MPNDLPDFVPRDIPKLAITDLSHTLSNNSMDSLTQVAGSVSYSPKVLVLPSDYISRDTAQLTRNIAKQWSVDGDGKTLLVVVDLKGHKVRAHGSPELNRAGVTSEYISDNLIPKQFIPYMKKGDLATAIRLTALDVNQKQSQSSLPLTQGSSVATISVPQVLSAENAPQANSNGLVTVILAIVIIGSCIGAGLSFVLFSKRKSSNRKVLQDLSNTLDSLYRKADQVAQASEYIQPGTDVQLSHDVADFFARLETVQKAQAQVEELSKSGFKINETEIALQKCCRYAKIMDFTATTLLNQVNEKTGVVSSFEANANIDESEDPEFASPGNEGVSRQAKVNPTAQKQDYVIKTNSRYRSPSWIADSMYSRRSDTDDDGLLAVSSYLNTVDRDSYPPIRWQNATVTNYGDSNKSSKSTFSNSLWNNTGSNGGGSWIGSSKSSSWKSSNSSSTQSSSSSESSDGGGSWSSSADSGSSSDSSSSSDGGGSW